MLLNVQKEEDAHVDRGVQLWIAILGAADLPRHVLARLLAHRPAHRRPAPAPLTEELVSLKGLATALFTDYLLPFEIVGLLLLVAVIGATVAARQLRQRDRTADDDGAATSRDPLRSLPTRTAPAWPNRPKEARLMSSVPISWYLLLSAVLFGIGAIGALTRRNGISIFLSVELMLNAGNLTLIAYARQWNDAHRSADRLLRDGGGRRRSRGGARALHRHLPPAAHHRRQPLESAAGVSARPCSNCSGSSRSFRWPARRSTAFSARSSRRPWSPPSASARRSSRSCSPSAASGTMPTAASPATPTSR